MQIILTPVAGDKVVALRVDEQAFSVNGKVYAYDALPKSGAVRLKGAAVIVEYGEVGGANTCQTTTNHSVEIIPSPIAPPVVVQDPAPVPDPDPADLRGAMSCYRWQMILALGQARWVQVQDFAASANAPWAMQMIIENAQLIPRLSETVDTLAWVLGLTETEVDDLFHTAMAIQA